MSTKFEQLLDYLVNEDHEKANELFHEIVVEKSREIYENLIAEEDMDDADMDDSGMDNMEFEDAFETDDGEDEHDTGDETDDFGGEISNDGDNFDHPSDDHEHEGQETTAIMDIKNAIEELEAAFAELEAAQSDEEGEMNMDADDDMDMGDDMDADDRNDEGRYMEGRRITREYVEKIGHDWDKNAQKGEQHRMAGAGTGDNEDQGGRNTKSVVSSGKGKPVTGATSENIVTDQDRENEDGVKPHGKAGGLVGNVKGEFTPKDLQNRPSANTKGYNTKSSNAFGLAGNTRNNGTEGTGVGAKTGGNDAGQTGGSTGTRSVEGSTSRSK